MAHAETPRDDDDEDDADEGEIPGLRQLFEMSLPEVEVCEAFAARPLGLAHKPRASAAADDDDEGEDEDRHFMDDEGDDEIAKGEEVPMPGGHGLPAENVTVKVLCAEMDQGTGWQSGKFVWPAAQALCAYLGSDDFVDASIARQDRVTRVLELGAGAGLVGIFLARLQARMHKRRGYVVLTDRDPFLLDMMKRSAALNEADGPMLPVETAELSWGGDDPSLDAFRRQFARRPFDLIVGADLMYSTETIELLFETVDQLLRHAEGREVAAQFVLCSSFRVEETSEMVRGHCRRLGLERHVLKNEIDQGGVIIERFVRAAIDLGTGRPDQAMRHALRELKRDEYGLYARIQSIHADAGFVERICQITFQGVLPVFANLRNGAWYASAPGCYFKSTDGHVTDPTFAARRLNLNVLRAVCNEVGTAESMSLLPRGYSGGAILVDATRRGKRFPDAFSRTVPIWCFVFNSVAGHAAGLDLPPWVPASERSALEARLGEWVGLVPAPAREAIRAILADKPPLRPVWVCCDTKQDWSEEARCTELVLPSRESEAPCTPIICLSASVAIDADTERIFRRAWRYIPGAGDDHEMWAGQLSPAVFWAHREALVACRSNQECEEVLARLTSQDTCAAQAQDSAVTSDAPGFSVVASAAASLAPIVLANDSFVDALDAAKHVVIDLRGQEAGASDEAWASALPADQVLVLCASAKELAQRNFWQTRCLPAALALCRAASLETRTCVVRADPLTPERATLATALACMGVSETADIKAEVNAALFRVSEAAGSALAQPPARKLLKNVIVFLHDRRRSQAA